MGSDFHLVDPVEGRGEGLPWAKGDFRLYGSGRGALASLIRLGMATRGWRRLWWPRYYCEDVIHKIRGTGVALECYSHGPGQGAVELPSARFRHGDVLLVVNYFGRGLEGGVVRTQAESVEVVEDHSHDLGSRWASESSADWCFASIRKTLPVPDGGVLWSPRHHRLPKPERASLLHLVAVWLRFAGMGLKASYLKGRPVPKPLFRSLLRWGEGVLGRAGPCGISAQAETRLGGIGLPDERRARVRNYTAFQQAFGFGAPGVVSQPAGAAHEESAPVGIVLEMESQYLRDRMQSRLAKERLYGAVLWPLELQASPSGLLDGGRWIDLSRRVLVLPCDMRYSESDMHYAAKVVLTVAGELRVEG